ncbi:MAG: WHG domain-containing protein [Rhizobiales bacterium]|nr:WHG domain-containing protein [Hyphomicrobiales bacterium]
MSKENLHNQAIATWALVHGLASLTIDGNVNLPENDIPARNKVIKDILMASL